MTGHSAHDDAGYVPKELFTEWEEKDPIVRLEKQLIAEGELSQDDIDEMQQECVDIVDDAVEWADAQPMPEPETCLDDVYYDG